MEHAWLFYALFFMFGYVTCRTFYFINASRKSVGLLQITQVVALFIIVRALEHFQYANTYRLFTMKKNKASDQNITAFELQFKDEMKGFKAKSIKQVIDAHGSFFKQMVDFHDWESAMTFLEDHRTHVETFITGDLND